MASKRVARTFVPPACQPGLLGGGEHAASMLRALDDERLNNRCDPEVSSGPRGRRPNPQQYNIVLRYLEGAEATRQREIVRRSRGFASASRGCLLSTVRACVPTQMTLANGRSMPRRCAAQPDRT